jgi:hypothetical protein
MPLQIALSHVKALPFDFEEAVAAFIKAKQDHRTKTGEAAPSPPHALVEAAVKRVPGSIDPPRPDDFVADYEIVDDTPPPPVPPTLDERKKALAFKVGQATAAAAAQVMPPLKRRLWDYEHARIERDIYAVQRKENEPNADWKARGLSAVQKASPADHAAYLAHEDRKAKVVAIVHHLAVCESAIHDLTEATIDAWAPAPFPT